MGLEVGEGLARHPRDRVERVGLAARIGDVVEEGAEGGVAQPHAGVGHALHQAVEAELTGEQLAGAIDRLPRRLLLHHLRGRFPHGLAERVDLRDGADGRRRRGAAAEVAGGDGQGGDGPRDTAGEDDGDDHAHAEREGAGPGEAPQRAPQRGVDDLGRYPEGNRDPGGAGAAEGRVRRRAFLREPAVPPLTGAGAGLQQRVGGELAHELFLAPRARDDHPPAVEQRADPLRRQPLAQQHLAQLAGGDVGGEDGTDALLADDRHPHGDEPGAGR